MKTKRIVSLVLVFLILLSTFSFDLKASDAVTNEEVIREDNEEKLSNETNEEEANSPVDESLSEEKEDESSEETSDDTVSFNDNWTYFEDGVDPSSTPGSNMWAFGQYNKDAAAKTGQAPFGAKDDQEYTKGGFTTKTLLKHHMADGKTVPTYFFVNKFNLEDTMSLRDKSLKFDLAYDDAVIIYLNREVIYKANVPDAGYSQSVEYGCKEKVGKPVKAEVSIPFTDLQGILTSGVNYLAVELHQYSDKSSDIYFDMQNIRFEDEAQKATSENEFATPVLTIGSNPSERNFTWYNKVNATGYVEVKEFGDSEGEIFKAEANENNRKEGFVNYKAHINGLYPDTEYELVYWNGENGTKSEAVKFKTAKEGDFQFFLVGDPQIGASGNKESDAQGWDKTLNIMKKRMTDEGTNFAFLLSAGDQINSYSSNEDEYVGFTERDGLKGMTLAPVIGNHDGENATRNGFFEHYTLPEFGNEGRADYAYVYNNTLFISLDSTYGVHQAEHSDFVKKTVEKYKNKVDWKVLTFHHAIYSVATHAVDKDILDRRQYIPKLVKDNGIDAVLMGHDHVYVRTHLMDGTEPIIEWKDGVEGKAPSEYINPKGALYITANSGSGSKFYRIQNEKFNYAAVQNQQKVPNYSEISVTDTTFKVVTYRTSDGSVVDEVTLKKEKAYAPVLTIGKDQSERNFTWYSESLDKGHVEVKEVKNPESVQSIECDAHEDNRKKGYANYKANIKGLKADTEYELVYWNGENGTKSEAVNFKTAKEGDFSFFLVGDPQIGASGNTASDAQGWDDTLNIMAEKMQDPNKNVAFLLSAGDQINDYDDNEDQYKQYIHRAGLKGMTLAPVIGNHDGEGNARSGYFEHFALPDLNEKDRADYAYVYNNTLFISLDSTYGWDAARHNDFVKKTVEKYEGKVDWKVLTFHHAIYSVASHAKDDDILDRRQYIPKLVKDNGIDAVLMGHDHVYVRSHIMNGTEPIIEWKDSVEGKAPSEYLNPKGALYITANSGSGSKFYRIQKEKFDYAAVQNQERVPNYSEITVTDNTFKVVTYRTSDGTVVDEVTLKKEKTQNPNPDPQPNPQPNPNPNPQPEPNPDNDNTIIIPPYEPDNRDEHSYIPRRPRTEKKEEKKEETKTIETNTKPIEKTKLSPIEVADKVLPVNFTDIVNEKRRDAIINLASRGVLAGIKKDKFMPNTTVTRAMVAAVFMRISIDKFINTSMSAKDITMKDWYFNSVKWAMTHGIVAGYSDGSFKPMKKVSRQELAVMLEALLKLYNINMPNVVDVDYSAYSYLPAWSRDAVIDVVRKGLLELNQDGKLGYDKEVSRADFAYAIDKIVEFALNN